MEQHLRRALPDRKPAVLGYHVPEDMYQDWLRYQQSQSPLTRDLLKVRVYRVYLLALAGAPTLDAMNLLKENELHSIERPG